MRVLGASLAFVALSGCAQFFEAAAQTAVNMAVDAVLSESKQGDPMKRILDADFHYRPSYDTNVRETFEKARREQQLKERKADVAEEGALRLVRLQRQSG